MILTEKETNAIEDLKTQEQACIEKYTKYSSQAKDPVLKELFEEIARNEQKHFDSLEGRTIALWGLSFKPETDDMREATSLVMIDLLRKAGAVVKVFDPVAIGECKRRGADRVVYAKDMYEAVIDADALLLLTEWKQFRLPSWAVIKKVMRQPLLLDGRNIYDA